MNKRITLHIASKDRHTELALCLQSLREQTYQDFDIMILDESTTPLQQSYFITYLINRLKLEEHRIKIIRQSPSYGVCFARNKLIKEDKFRNEYTLRCDDDVILEPQYLEKLFKVIDQGYDMASGVVPHIAFPEIKRQNKFVGPIINRLDLDEQGNIIKYGDDCGYCYLEEEIIPAPQFRTNCLYKSEINKKICYEKNLSQTGFREEAFFSLRAILLGYKMAVHTNCKCYHFSTPSGGVRCPNYADNVKLDHETFCKWLKEKVEKHGNFLEEYYKNGVYKRA